MTTRTSATTWRVGSGVRWAVERSGLLLTDGRGGVARLGYPEAAIWDLFSRGYSHSDVTAMLGCIASIELRAADALVESTVERWAADGFLEKAD